VSRIILVTAYNPADVSKWSGTLYYLHAALQRNPRGSITHVRGGLALLDLAARAFNKCLQKCGITLDCRLSTAYGVLAGLYLAARLQFAPGGTLLAVVGSTYMGYVKNSRKQIYISDATFQARQSLYPYRQAFPGWLNRQGHRSEDKSLASLAAGCVLLAYLSIHRSDWDVISPPLRWQIIGSSFPRRLRPR
jgi:hypothetical protein